VEDIEEHEAWNKDGADGGELGISTSTLVVFLVSCPFA
jgi:hypothetical protein